MKEKAPVLIAKVLAAKQGDYLNYIININIIIINCNMITIVVLLSQQLEHLFFLRSLVC